MAGSYNHVDPDNEGGWSLIENMGDAAECVEELLFLVRAHLDASEIEAALKVFYDFKTGRKSPTELPEGSPEFESLPSLSDYAKAYLDTMRAMDS